MYLGVRVHVDWNWKIICYIKHFYQVHQSSTFSNYLTSGNGYPLPRPRSTLRASFVASQFVEPGAGRTTFNSTATPLHA